MADAVDDRGVEPPSTTNPTDWARWLGPAGGIALAIVLVNLWFGDSIRANIDANTAAAEAIEVLTQTRNLNYEQDTLYKVELTRYQKARADKEAAGP